MIEFHTLDDALFNRALSLLDEEWLAHDAELGPVLPTVLARHVGQDWHKAGTFRHHLQGVARTLTLWEQPAPLRLLGLLHSVYGNAYVDLVKFDPASERARLREAVGEEVERLVHLFCTMPRTRFVQGVLQGALEADGSMVLDGKDGRQLLAADEVAAFIVLTMADTAEQWYSWQDDIFSRYPDHRSTLAGPVHWAASLWPGPMRPTARMVAQAATLGSALRHPALRGRLPMPPVFNQCRARLAPRDEATGVSLYWSVIQQDQPLVDADVAIAVLEQAVAHNPWVGEPQLVLAQLYLTVGEFERAEAAAAGGLQMLCAWGTAWDKRIGWDAWLAWGRILLQGATTRNWPARLDKLNNLALAPARPAS
ncbi:MAG: hypothetical protein JWR60_3742 [Polaromonas sp.]|nr:hypothetical protein [Polaromonas sp.]